MSSGRASPAPPELEQSLNQDDRDADAAEAPADSDAGERRCCCVGCCGAVCGCCRRVRNIHRLDRDIPRPSQGLLRFALCVIFIAQPIVALCNVGGFVYEIIQFRREFIVLNPPTFWDSEDREAFLVSIAWALTLPFLHFALWYAPLYALFKRSAAVTLDDAENLGDEEYAALTTRAGQDLPPWAAARLPEPWAWRDTERPLDRRDVAAEDLLLRADQLYATKLSFRRQLLATLACASLSLALAAATVAATGPKKLGASGVLFIVGVQHRVAYDTVRAGTVAMAEQIFFRIVAFPLCALAGWIIMAALLLAVIFRLSRALWRSRAIVPLVVGVLTYAALIAVFAVGLLTTGSIPTPRQAPDLLTSRGFCFRNSCNVPLRIGQIGGATGIDCAAGCPRGTICNPGHGCYFDIDFEVGSLMLGPGGVFCHPFDYAPVHTTSKPKHLPATHMTVQWSGAIYASGGCDSNGICESALCRNCPSYEGPVGPVTQAELTLGVDAKDYYDITIINGANYPLAVHPIAIPGTDFAADPEVPAEYHCRDPGNAGPIGRTPGASWHFDSPAALGNHSLVPLVSLAGSGQPCAATSECPAGEACGTAMATLTSGLPENFVHRGHCGPVIGVWSHDELCGWTDAHPFIDCKMGVQVPGEPAGVTGTVEQLYQCNPPFGVSCFQPVATDSCCGCETWSSFIPVASEQCVSSNPTWQAVAKPHLEVLKKACPTCYTYPYDDPTSTFTCMTNTTTNQASYEFEWCPAGTTITVS